MKQQYNTNKIIESLEHSQRAEPSTEFLLKIENLALRYTSVAEKVSLNAIMGVAASFLLLLMFNMAILTTSDDSTMQQATTDIVSSYDLIPTKSLYHE